MSARRKLIAAIIAGLAILGAGAATAAAATSGHAVAADDTHYFG